jgi:hypothetical protein
MCKNLSYIIINTKTRRHKGTKILIYKILHRVFVPLCLRVYKKII